MTTRSIGWNEAITPLGRVSRRRWVAFYVLLLVATGAISGWSDGLGAPDVEYGPPFVAVCALMTVFGMLRRSTRELAAVRGPELDERDRQQIGSAFRYAYPLFLAVMVASLAVLVLALPQTETQTYAIGSTDVVGQRFLLSWQVIVGVVVWGFLWAVFLPTAVLAWREPDAVPSDDSGALPREEIRDLMLAGGLVLALAVGLAGDSQLYGVVVSIGAVVVAAAYQRERAGHGALQGSR